MARSPFRKVSLLRLTSRMSACLVTIQKGSKPETATRATGLRARSSRNADKSSRLLAYARGVTMTWAMCAGTSPLRIARLLVQSLAPTGTAREQQSASSMPQETEELQSGSGGFNASNVALQPSTESMLRFVRDQCNLPVSHTGEGQLSFRRCCRTVRVAGVVCEGERHGMG